MKKRLLASLMVLCLMLALLSGAVLAVAFDKSQITIKKTEIRADDVANVEGYGSLEISWDAVTSTPPQMALIDSNGFFIFPYQGNEFLNGKGDHYFFCSDDIVSFTASNAYIYDNYDNLPQYYNLDGSPAFTLEESRNEYIEEDGTKCIEETTFWGGPMWDGYAVVIKRIFSTYISSGTSVDGSYNGSSVGMDTQNKTLIIDKNGTITCELPDAFNEDISLTEDSMFTKKLLTMCGEGMFAVFKNELDENNWGNYITTGEGYIDPYGKTVIDLRGRGYVNLLPFYQGLAGVMDQNEKCGFIDKSGTEVIPCIYDGTGSFSEDGLCPVAINGKHGYVNKKGEVVIPLEYDYADIAGCGFAPVMNNNKWGLINQDNEVIVPFEYDKISSTTGGIAYALKDGFVYIISCGMSANRLTDGVKYVPYYDKVEDYEITSDTSIRYELDGTLPSGLSLDPQTAVISGVPMAEGTWNFTVNRITNSRAEGGTTELPRSLTILSNTDAAVQRPNDYNILVYVGTPDRNDPNHFYKTEYSDETLKIDGPYYEFYRLLIDGIELHEPADYVSEEGSTVITIHSQTFQKFGEGTHTIAAEFRPAGATNAEVKRVAQNYTLNLSKPSSGGGSHSKPSINPSAQKPQNPQPQQTAIPFADVSPPDWYYEDVVWAYTEGVMQGVDGSHFDPEGKVSQATIVTVLARLAKVDLTRFEGETEPGFPDGQYFTAAAIWAKRAGLLPQEGTFTGNETTTRNQMAVMLTKYLTSMGKGTTPPTQPVAFDDAAEMSQEGNAAFQVLYQYEIFRGTGGLKMEPAGSTTRAQFAALMHRIYDTAIS